MILSHLRLNNIRSYTDQEIRFPQGSCLMSGDIGSGKSTILLAIEFALFGIKRGSLSGSALLRHGSVRGSVELAFTLNEERIVIRRNLRRVKDRIKQEAGFIVHNDIKTEGTPVELKSKIYELLGYPSDLVTKGDDLIYRYTVYTPQEQMKSIIVDDAESRLDILRRTFNIDKYKRIKTNASSYIVKLRQRKAEYRGAISTLGEKKDLTVVHKQDVIVKQQKLNSKEETTTRIRQELSQKESALATLQRTKEEQSRLRMELKARTEQLKGVMESVTLNTEKKTSLSKELANIQESLQKLKVERMEGSETELEQTVSDTEELIAKVDAQRITSAKDLEFESEKLDGIEKAIEGRIDLITKISHNKQRIMQIEGKLGERNILKKRIEESRGHIEGLNDKISRLKAQSDGCDGNIKDLKTLKNCPTCLQKVDGQHKDKLIDKETKQKNKLLSEMDIHNKDRELDQKRITRFESELEMLDKKEKDVALLKAETERLEQDNRELDEKKKDIGPIKKKIEILKPLAKTDTTEDKKNLAGMKSRLSKLRENNKKLEERKRIESIISEKSRFLDSIHQDMLKSEDLIRTLSLEIDGFRGRLIDGVDTRFEKAKESLEEVRAIEREAIVELAKMSKELEGQMMMIEGLEKEIALMEEMKNRMMTTMQLENWLDEFFIKAVHSMERQVMFRIHSQFNELFINWFRMLIEDDTLNARLDEDFTPVIEQNGYETEVANLSGGEKTSLALAYRLALNKVINDLIHTIKTRNLIILDEPTDGFSTDQLDRIRDVLDELSSEQVIIVSHEPKMESYVDHLLKVEKTEHVSTIDL